MSRTYVHRPGWVQERDPLPRREFRDDHVHTTAECWDRETQKWLVRYELPCDLRDFYAAKGWTHTHCRPQHRGGRNPYCGCRMCTGYYWRRAERRRDRHQARRALRRGWLADG